MRIVIYISKKIALVKLISKYIKKKNTKIIIPKKK